MSSLNDYRLYTFVANHYLSPLQCGLQTAHVVSEMAHQVSRSPANPAAVSFDTWAREDKTIIICGAGNHKGVLDCWAELKRTGIDPGFVTGAIFFEDEQSMNGMATACGVIVPRRYWDVTWVVDATLFAGGYWLHAKVEDPVSPRDYERYDLNYPEGQFISHLKKYRLA